MEKNDALHKICQDAINRMSNLGMAVKTAGVAFFGAGVAHWLTIDTSPFPKMQVRYYCFVLAIFILMFNFIDISYLSRERALREIDALILKGLWAVDYIDFSVLPKSEETKRKISRINCLGSFAVWPIFSAEVISILFLLKIGNGF